ncbi:chemotaxis protein CheW, partial [bacterium]|nr:chemotaxis protein CheW [bacterium]
NSEIKEVIDAKPYRELPGLPPIMTGISEHNGKILPVIDLSPYFSKKSSARPGSKMILIENGDFEALLLAEAVSDVKLLPVVEHKELPLSQPHQDVYGGYIYENEVRLLLNTLSLVQSFDKNLLKNYLDAISLKIGQGGESGKAQDNSSTEFSREDKAPLSKAIAWAPKTSKRWEAQPEVKERGDEQDAAGESHPVPSMNIEEEKKPEDKVGKPVEPTAPIMTGNKQEIRGEERKEGESDKALINERQEKTFEPDEIRTGAEKPDMQLSRESKEQTVDAEDQVMGNESPLRKEPEVLVSIDIETKLAEEEETSPGKATLEDEAGPATEGEIEEKQVLEESSGGEEEEKLSSRDSVKLEEEEKEYDSGVTTENIREEEEAVTSLVSEEYKEAHTESIIEAEETIAIEKVVDIHEAQKPHDMADQYEKGDLDSSALENLENEAYRGMEEEPAVEREEALLPEMTDIPENNEEAIEGDSLHPMST